MSMSTTSKRPRPSELDHDVTGNDIFKQDASTSLHPSKRQCSLPLRLSPFLPPQELTPSAPSADLYALPTTLTPTDSSDEDIAVDRNESDCSNDVKTASSSHDLRSNPAATPTSSTPRPPQSNNLGRTDMPPPPPSGDLYRKPGMARRRANGISSGTVPARINFSTNANTTPADGNGGRVPTPIYGHFTSTDVNMDTSEAAMSNFIHPAARFQLGRTHNILSPMMSEDGESEADWWHRRRLPSPADSPVASQQMDVDVDGHPGNADDMDDVPCPDIGAMDLLSSDRDHTQHPSDKISPLQLENNLITPAATPNSCASSSGAGDCDYTMLEHHAVGNPGSIATSSQSRKGKLVMGFRSDCDKCQKHAPGHYSHIVWS